MAYVHLYLLPSCSLGLALASIKSLAISALLAFTAPLSGVSGPSHRCGEAPRARHRAKDVTVARPQKKSCATS